MASEPPRSLSFENFSPDLPPGSGAGLKSPRSPHSTSTATYPSSLKTVNNPLSSKVAGILASSYADTDFRDSLALLDGRHVKNNAETRRKLRQDIQKEVIDGNGEVIAEFGRVADQLRRIGRTIEKLNSTYSDIKTEIDAAHSTAQPVLEEASVLIDRRRNVETRRQLLNAFVGHFVLTDDEIATLTMTAEPVDERFFAVLKKAKKISKDCEILLGFEDNQSLGSEIMEQTSKNINLGYQKLYKWAQREFKALNLENPQMGSAMSRALRVLAERPTLFQSCLDSFAEARENILSDAFYTALTGIDGVANNASRRRGVKPIELAAHDPLRYTGDMLAWIHSATVSEREALESLFVADGGELARGIQEGRENEVWRLAKDDGEDDKTAFDPIGALNDLVDRDLSGVARLLRQRMEQVVQINEEIILSFKLANLLNFYKLTFAKLLGGGAGVSGDRGDNNTHGPSNGKGNDSDGKGNDGDNKSNIMGKQTTLVGTLDGLEKEALRHFRSLLRDRVAGLRSDFDQGPTDLAIPEFLQDTLEQLNAIMKTYDTSLAALESREPGFEPILNEALDPFLAGCREVAGRTATAVDGNIFLINCLMAAREKLSAYDFTTGRVALLQEEIDGLASALVDNQYGFFCEQSGVEDMFAELAMLSPDNRSDLRRAAKLDLLQPAALTEVSQRLDDFLPSALMDATENLKPLQDPKLARQLTEEAAERFCVTFEHVETLLDATDRMLFEEDADRDPETALRTRFPRTTVEIRVLLS